VEHNPSQEFYKMKKTLLAIALASSLTSVGALAADKAPEPDFSISGNFGLTNDYRYRGVSQSKKSLAASGGFDLAHKNGFYVGNWNSSISWLNGTSSSGLESDVYAGYRTELMGLSIDIGDLYYYYPGVKSGENSGVSPNTNEVYVSLGYGPVSFKTSYSTTNLFGNSNSDGSLYYDLTVAHSLSDKVSAKVHVGYTNIKGTVADEGYDYLVGVSYDLGDGYSVGISYVNTSGDYKTFNAASGSGASGLISLTKTF
jgi:uncharacterized protein (TIGR02001 family)